MQQLFSWVVLNLLLCHVAAKSSFEGKIQHIVVVMLENRAFDHIFGYYPGANGLTGEEYNLRNASDPASEKVYVSKGAPYMNICDPEHNLPSTTNKIFATQENFIHRNPTMGGFIQEQVGHPKYCNVLQGFTPDQLPVINALAQEYVLMDRFFASVPGPTWPNRLFALAATSGGDTATGVWYEDISGGLFPHRTVFDQVEEAGGTWKNYYNDTPWELFVEKVAHNPDKLQPLDAFFTDAAAGTLPSYSWVNPRSGINITSGVGSNDQHPDHDMNAGEQYYKDIYEALRASPQWNSTLMIVTYDEHGGFFDHVPTPMVAPAPDDSASYPDTFSFTRLGVRIPTLLISPWLPRGYVQGAPPQEQKPTPSSEYDLTSILATSRKLLGINDAPLTRRDAWVATFEHLFTLLDEPRTDCPMHMPDAVQPVEPILEASLPINDLQLHILQSTSRVAAKKVQKKHMTQKDHSEMVADHFQHYHHHARRWKKHKQMNSKGEAQYQVTLLPKGSYDSGVDDYAWHLNGVAHGDDGEYAGLNTPFITVSTRNLRVPDTSVPYCLDAGAAVEGAVITISPCFPSEDPLTNVDVAQHFVLDSKGALQYYADQTLCVTNLDPQGVVPNSSLVLSKCVRSVEQNWAYHGRAPGEGGGGQLEFGDVEYYLGVMHTNASKM